MTLFVYILRFRAVVTGSNPTSFIVRISHWGLVYYEKFTMDPGSYARSKRIIKKILLGPILLIISVIFLTKILWTNQCRGGSGRFRILYSGNDLCTKCGIIYRNVHTFLEGGPTKNKQIILLRKLRSFPDSAESKPVPANSGKSKSVSLFLATIDVR